MTLPFARPLTLIVGAATLTLAGCSSSDPATLDPTPSEQGALTVDGDTNEAPEAPAEGDNTADPVAADGEPLSASGMPDLPLLGCSEQVDFTQAETDFDTQWRWEFVCRTTDPFFKTVDGMNNNAGFAHTVDAPSGNPDYLNDKHHYIADYNGVAWDVDLAASGEPGELEVTYVVTLAKP